MSVSTGQTDQGDDTRVIVPAMDVGEHWGTPRTGASHDDAYAPPNSSGASGEPSR
jgi:hypothetical protein